MKKVFSFLFLIASACSTQLRVYSDYDRDYSIREFTTYTWAGSKEIESKNNPLYYNELNDKRIKNAVNAQLENKGYLPTPDNPRLIVHYHIVVEDRTIVTTDPYGHYYSPYWMRLQTNIYPYREGTLIIDLMDANTDNLIWRGWAVAVLENVYNTDQVEDLINTAVTRIFKDFPQAVARKEGKPL
jgi:hypothetical protein